jgi:hypothetical protein
MIPEVSASARPRRTSAFAGVSRGLQECGRCLEFQWQACNSEEEQKMRTEMRNEQK